MWHSVLIAAHATTGGVALLAGAVAIRGRALFGTYLWALVAMEVFLVLAIAAEWTVIDVPSQVPFAGFAALGLFMVWRADRARRIRPLRAERPCARYVEHVGFTLVALFDAFLVIVVLNLGEPAWLIVAAGVLVAAVGHVVLRAVRARVAGSAPRQALDPAPPAPR